MKDLKLNLLRHHEREERKDALKQQEFLLNHPKVEDKTQVRKNIDQIKSQLDHLSPEPLNGPEKDQLHNLQKRLAESIKEGMPTDEEMRKNPVGAVHRHRVWERAKKPLIKAWKNIRIQLNPDSDDKDLCNVERLRPSGQMDRLRTDAQITGKMSYTTIPDELWPFEPPANTALKQAQRSEQDRKAKIAQSLRDVQAAVGTQEPVHVETGKRKRRLTPEGREAIRANMARTRAILQQKRAERKAAKEAAEQTVS